MHFARGSNQHRVLRFTDILWFPKLGLFQASAPCHTRLEQCRSERHELIKLLWRSILGFVTFRIDANEVGWQERALNLEMQAA